MLSRLVAPSEMGVYSTAIATVGIATIFADSGLSLSAVRARSLDQAQRSTLFSVNVIVGALCTALVASVAQPLGVALSNGEVGWVVLLVSPAFLASGVGVQFRVELNRSGRYAALAVADVTSQLAGLGVAVAFALSGFGAKSLALQYVAAAVFATGLAFVFARWRPSRGFNLRSVAEEIREGGYAAGAQIVNYISSNVGAVSLGAGATFGDAGVYSRMQQLFLMPLQQLVSPLTRAAIPRLVDAQRNSGYTRLLARLAAVVCYVVFTALGGLWLAAPAVIDVVLGSQWLSGALVLRAFVVGGVAQAAGYGLYWHFLAAGKMRSLMLAELPGRIFILTGAPFVASHGAAWMAVLYSAGMVAVFLGAVILFFRESGAGGVYLVALVWPAVVLVLMTLLGHAALRLTASQGGVLSMVIALLSGVVALVICAVLSVRVRGDLRLAFRVLRKR